MNPMFDPLNIILIAAAAIVFWRLKAVLGSRTGFEKPGFDPLVLKKPQPPQEIEATAIDVTAEPLPPIWQGFATEDSVVAKGLEAIAAASPDFAAKSFVEGSKLAYEMVLEAFSKGDKQALKPLLSKEVLESFSQEIDQRVKKGEQVTFQFVGVKSAKMELAELSGKRARIGMNFVGEMIKATQDKDGNLLEGDTKKIHDVADFWIFERDVSQRDPNWKLVDTSNEGP
jgi:predicted lipid-binding transport protein (Tim44 family)